MKAIVANRSDVGGAVAALAGSKEGREVLDFLAMPPRDMEHQKRMDKLVEKKLEAEFYAYCGMAFLFLMVGVSFFFNRRD